MTMATTSWTKMCRSIWKRRLLYVYFCFSVLSCGPTQCMGSPDEQRLLTNLTVGYKKSVRPVINDSKPLKVFVGLSISQIIDVDERNQVMTTSLWLKQRWHDYRLTWDPLDYGNMTTIHIPITTLWKPDLVLYNNVAGAYDVQRNTMALAFHNGSINWYPPAVYKSACKIDIQYFPFDEQKCILKFGSWAYDSSKIDLEMLTDRIETELYWTNQEWDIVDTPIEKHSVKYPCCDDNYIDLTFTFVLHRKSLFYAITLVLPCVFISVLTIFVFYLPSECSEKITLCISILLALIVFLLLIAESVPTTSQSISVIGSYLLFTMTMVSFSTAITVLIINIFFRGADVHTMPTWVKMIFLDSNLAKFLWVERPANYLKFNVTCDQEQRSKSIMATSNSHEIFLASQAYSDSSAGDRSVFTRNAFGGVRPNIYKPISKMERYNLAMNSALEEEMEWSGDRVTLANGKNKENNGKAELPEPFKEGLRCLNFIVEHTKDADRNRKVEEDWSYVSMIIDRICLYIYILAVFLGTTSILLSSTVLWEPEGFHPTQVVDQPIEITKVKPTGPETLTE